MTAPWPAAVEHRTDHNIARVCSIQICVSRLICWGLIFDIFIYKNCRLNLIPDRFVPELCPTQFTGHYTNYTSSGMTKFEPENYSLSNEPKLHGQKMH